MQDPNQYLHVVGWAFLNEVSNTTLVIDDALLFHPGALVPSFRSYTVSFCPCCRFYAILECEGAIGGIKHGIAYRRGWLGGFLRRHRQRKQHHHDYGHEKCQVEFSFHTYYLIKSRYTFVFTYRCCRRLFLCCDGKITHFFLFGNVRRIWIC